MSNTNSSINAGSNSPMFRRIQQEIQGEVLHDTFSRGRYSTDASIYQLMPIGVVIPASEQDVEIAVQIAAEEGVPVLPRGAGTSQNGQAIGEALLIDTTRSLNKLIDFDKEQATACVQPGMVLDELNRQLKAEGLWYPVDVSTANRATIGGMAGNNSCGARSIRYGNMVHNVRSIEALLADGSRAHFKKINGEALANAKHQELINQLLALGQREANEIAERFPPRFIEAGLAATISMSWSKTDPNLASLLVGSEGTLGFFQRIHLNLQPIPKNKVLGVCHFPTLL